MTLILDLLEEMLPNLTNMQKGLLISVHASSTPQQAFETANGTVATISAKDELINLGLIKQSGNQLQLSPMGEASLLSNNLVADGQITDEGTQQMQSFEANKNKQVNLESFTLFKSFIKN
jgi:hypothetical protein